MVSVPHKVIGLFLGEKYPKTLSDSIIYIYIYKDKCSEKYIDVPMHWHKNGKCPHSVNRGETVIMLRTWKTFQYHALIFVNFCGGCWSNAISQSYSIPSSPEQMWLLLFSLTTQKGGD